MDSLPLNRLFGRYLFNNPDDLNLIDRALRGLGILQAPPAGLSTNPAQTVYGGVETFQRAADLAIDGRLRPDGPTARMLAQALAAKVAQPTPGLPPVDPYGRPIGNPWPWRPGSSAGLTAPTVPSVFPAPPPAASLTPARDAERGRGHCRPPNSPAVGASSGHTDDHGFRASDG